MARRQRRPPFIRRLEERPGRGGGPRRLSFRRRFKEKTRARDIHIGHTGITWPNDQADLALAAIASLGFYGFETFGDVLVNWESKGGLGPLLQKNNIALISGYCTVNLTDPTQRADQMTKAELWCDLIKKY